MPERKYTRVIIAHNGRYAVMAREHESAPWAQIESVLGEADAVKFADKLEHDDAERHAYIYDSGEEGEWGDHAPAMEVK